jgi:hypothetical protein
VSRAPEPSDAPIVAEYLWETIICDLHWSAFHIAMLTTLVCAAARGKAEWTVKPWRHVLQSNAKIMKLALRDAPRIGLSQHLADRISNLYTVAGVAKQCLEPLTKTSSPYTQAERLQLREVSGGWRDIAQEAKSVILLIAPDVKLRLAENYTRDGAALVALLFDAGNGDIRRVGPSGELTLPELSQRRYAPRIIVSHRCKLELPDLVVLAQIDDVSREGLGGACAHLLRVNDDLCVRLSDGRRLKAKVARVSPGRFGLRLASPLPTDDPLFSVAGRAEV